MSRSLAMELLESAVRETIRRHAPHQNSRSRKITLRKLLADLFNCGSATADILCKEYNLDSDAPMNITARRFR